MLELVMLDYDMFSRSINATEAMDIIVNMDISDGNDRKYKIQVLDKYTQLRPPIPATIDPFKFLDAPLGPTNLIQNGVTTLRLHWSSCTEIWSLAKGKPLTCPSSSRAAGSEKGYVGYHATSQRKKASQQHVYLHGMKI